MIDEQFLSFRLYCIGVDMEAGMSRMTVKKLKEIIKDWPEERGDGEDTEVWIETGLMLSSQVVNWSKLNVRVDENGKDSYDLLLESNAFENNDED